MGIVHTDLAYGFIRKKILAGEFPAGMPLASGTLAAQIGLSRTPIRDALRKLESDGLVTIQAHLGACVREMDANQFREMCVLRLALESHAAGLAALHHADLDLHEIQLALETMRRLTSEIIAADEEIPLLGELIRADVRFHIAIISAARNDLIKQQILRLHLINRVVSGPSLRPKTAESDRRRRLILKKHEEIFAAISRSDAAAARSAMESHLEEMIAHNLLRRSRPEDAMARDLTARSLISGA